MNKFALISAILFISGIIVFVISAMLGQSNFALFLIFPVFYSTGPLGALGILLIFAAMILFFISPAFGEANVSRTTTTVENKKESHYGGVILIGPIPIVFGSDAHHALYAVVLAILVLAVFAAVLIFTGI